MSNAKSDLLFVRNIAIAIFVLLFISFFDGCNTKNHIKKTNDNVTEMREEINITYNELDSIFYTKEEVDLIIEIQSYKISKRMLYDNNAIVRTKIRPDDRMIEYDKKIEQLEKKLKQIRRNNE